MRNAIFIGVLLLLVLGTAGGAYVFLARPEYTVARAVEDAGRTASGSKVQVEKVTFSPASNEAKIANLRVPNPEGFPAGDTIIIGKLTAKVAPTSSIENGLTILQEISISDAHIAYRTRGETSNLGALAAHANKVTEAAQKSVSPKERAQKANKIIVDNLYMRDTVLTVINASGKSIERRMATLHLSNVGRTKDGVTPVEVAQIFLAEVERSASRVASEALAER